ncbi:hypothetical protein TNCV_3832031 [Trichonephila clavipes]|nr:hypothetical protein TNCV_3832031 [Trichonephila clavipes]
MRVVTCVSLGVKFYPYACPLTLKQCGLTVMVECIRAHINQYRECETLRRMEWPACSPDLIPTEIIWNVLGKRLSVLCNPSQNLNDLKTCLLREWATRVVSHCMPLSLLVQIVKI